MNPLEDPRRLIGIANANCIAHGCARVFREVGAKLTGNAEYIDGGCRIMG